MRRLQRRRHSIHLDRKTLSNYLDWQAAVFGARSKGHPESEQILSNRLWLASLPQSSSRAPGPYSKNAPGEAGRQAVSWRSRNS